MANESVSPSDNLLCVEWRTRALMFFVDEDEEQNLEGHAKQCTDCSVGILRAIEYALRYKASWLDGDELKDAIAGAAFLTGMAQQLRKRLGETT